MLQNTDVMPKSQMKLLMPKSLNLDYSPLIVIPIALKIAKNS